MWHSTEVALVLPTQQPQGSILGIPKDLNSFLDVAKISRRQYLECEQLKYVDQARIV